MRAATPSRRLEFVVGRDCARRALGQIGVSPVAILAGSRGEPLWPAGVVGSITHCAGYVAAAVAWAEDVPALGIDAEPNEPLPAGVLDAVATPAERRDLVGRPAGTCWDRLLFSAKESAFKAWYPRQQRMLGFEDVVVDLDLDHRFGTSLRGFAGHWTVDGGVILTAVVGDQR